jgi:hypothetical protein
MYKAKKPFNVAMKILVPTHTMVKGSPKTTYSAPENSADINGSFSSYGGTDSISNGMITVVKTAVVETWYRPDITSDCHLYICETGEEYQVIGDPENIDMRHQYLRIKVEKVGGAV